MVLEAGIYLVHKPNRKRPKLKYSHIKMWNIINYKRGYIISGPYKKDVIACCNTMQKHLNLNKEKNPGKILIIILKLVSY